MHPVAHDTAVLHPKVSQLAAVMYLEARGRDTRPVGAVQDSRCTTPTLTSLTPAVAPFEGNGAMLLVAHNSVCCTPEAASPPCRC